MWISDGANGGVYHVDVYHELEPVADPVYATIVPDPQAELRNGKLSNMNDLDGVIYTELHRVDALNPTVEPSDDLYANAIPYR